MDENKNGKVIMAGNTTCACGAGCSCGCGHCHGRVVWWIIGIIILFGVFFLGIALGRFGERLHEMYGGYDYGRYPRVMMNGYYGTPVAQPGIPVNGGVTTGTAPAAR